MMEYTDQQSNGLKKACEKKDEEITSYSDGREIYHINDTVYIESQRPDMPYFICSIRDFKRTKKDIITVHVIWYYRPCEIPTSVYQLLLQDRNDGNGSSDHLLDNPVVNNRELFISDAIDIYPASALRGHANCMPFSDVKENVMKYIEGDDNWFYILRYNPESRRMANAKGEIRIGASHQACLPAYIPHHLRSRTYRKELHENCKEELVWDPSIPKSKLTVYLRAAKSITSFNGYCDDQEGCSEKLALVDDQTVAYTYDTLHKNNYNISEALQDLIRNPQPKKTFIPWSDDERKRFMRGLRSYGKTFHKIRKELLPQRATSELVHYYYVWKKTAVAISSRPHKRGGRRNNVLKRNTRTTKPKTVEATEFLDLSSCSENELEDSEDSENARDLSLYACRHCFTTRSPNWHHAGKPKVLLCHCCRMYFKRYGRMKALKEEEKREPPSFIYKAAFENLDEQVSYSGRMRTRRSSTPVFTSANTRARFLHEAKVCMRKQVTTQNILDNQSDKEEADGKTGGGMKRKNSQDNDDTQESKKSRLEQKESDEAEDADDESEGDSETGSRSDSNARVSTESSRSQSPIPNLNREERVDPPVSTVPTTPHPFLPIKQEEPEEITNPVDYPPSPDVPDDPELNKKVAQRFKHNSTQPGSSCSRCDMIFVFKRPKKRRSIELDTPKRRDEHCDKDNERRRDVSPPTSHQPAQITSHYEAMRMMVAQGVRSEPQRYWPGYHPVPPEVAHAHHRSISPRDYLNDPASKFSHILKVLDRPTDHRSPHTPSIPGHQTHPAHPFTPRPSESARDFRVNHTPRSHMSSLIPGLETLSRAHTGPPNPIDIDRVPSIDRPVIDPVTGLPPPVQPHLHSHLHTHTHLHVHPDDIKYRGHGIPPEAAHYERHERTTPHQVPAPPQPPHRPNSRSREYHEHLLKYPELLAQMHHDPHHIRESLARHLPAGARESHLPPGREGAVSPSIPHENIQNDPVAYHLWLTRMHHRWNSHGGSQSHGQAPELSPHGIPQSPRHNHDIRSEHDKHIKEKLFQAHVEHEKLVARADPMRTLEHDKHLRQILQAREHAESMKMKGEHIPERPFRAADIHTSYHNSPFMDSIRRAHDARPSMHDDRNIHDVVRYTHERERAERERAEREHIAHMERIVHSERFTDRARHERPSIFGHYKPETIDLSED